MEQRFAIVNRVFALCWLPKKWSFACGKIMEEPPKKGVNESELGREIE